MSARKDAILASRKRSTNVDILNTFAQKDSVQVFADLDDFIDRPDNRPLDQGKVDRLVRSIEKDGLGQPVLARSVVEGGISRKELIAGQHRREAYRVLRKMHPDDPKWRTIECTLRTNMDDRTAHRLMLATNLNDADIEPAERGRMLIELEGEVPAMRREDPDLAGKRTSAIIADVVEEAGGGKMSSRTVERKIRAAKVSDEAARCDNMLISVWRNEFDAGSYAGDIRSAIANFDLKEQRDLFERWEDAGKGKDWLRVEIQLRDGCADKIAARAAGEVKNSMKLLKRALAAGADPMTAGSALTMAEELKCELRGLV